MVGLLNKVFIIIVIVRKFPGKDSIFVSYKVLSSVCIFLYLSEFCLVIRWTLECRAASSFLP